MSLGPEKIIVILVVALIVFGPQRLPEVARQVGAAMRELRKMQDTVRGELDRCCIPTLTARPARPAATRRRSRTTDHAALHRRERSAIRRRGRERRTDDVTDDGFAGPRSFS